MICLCLIVFADLTDVVDELLLVPPSFVLGADTSILKLHAHIPMAFYLVFDDGNIFRIFRFSHIRSVCPHLIRHQFVI